MRPADFWTDVDALIDTSRVVIDRPRHTPHPRSPEHIYPLDYGYLEGTTSGDGAGIDAWIGSLPDRRPTGVICTIDLGKRDMEIKLLLGCSPDEIASVRDFFATLRIGHELVLRD